MRTPKEKTRCETTNRPGRLFEVILIASMAISRCAGQEMSLEPMELLDLPLSKLSSVTAETSATAQRLQVQRRVNGQEPAKACAEGTGQAASGKCENNVPVFFGFGSPENYPLYPYRLFATDEPWPAQPAREAGPVPLETLAEVTKAEDAPETAALEMATEPGLLENHSESLVKDVQAPMPSDDHVESSPVADVLEPTVKNEIWESRIAAPKDTGYEQMKLELQKIIYQVRTVELEARQERTVSDTKLTAETTEPNGPQPHANEVHVAKQKELEQVRPPYIPVSDSTLKALEDIAAKANGQGAGLGNAMELAGILYRSGRLEQAAKIYRLAYQAAAADDNVAVEDKAWVLLQVGNCLREMDANAAAEAYRQLVTEYANSMWKDMAKTQLELLNWYAGDKPEELVAQKAVQLVGRQSNTEP